MQFCKAEKDFFYESKINQNKLITIQEENIRKNQEKNSLISDEAYKELYKPFSLTITESALEEFDNITHNETVNGKEYKYGLTVKNEIPFSDLVIINKEEENLPKTATENLYELLDLNKESSYESLILKFSEEFNHGKL
jgi:hypothetical protein